MPAETSPGARMTGFAGMVQNAGLETTVKRELVERSDGQLSKVASTDHANVPLVRARVAWVCWKVATGSPFRSRRYDAAPTSDHSKVTGEVTVVPSSGAASVGRMWLMQAAGGV